MDIAQGSKDNVSAVSKKGQRNSGMSIFENSKSNKEPDMHCKLCKTIFPQSEVTPWQGMMSVRRVKAANLNRWPGVAINTSVRKLFPSYTWTVYKQLNRCVRCCVGMVVAQVGHLICITVLPFKCRPQFSEYVNLVFVLIHLHFLNMYRGYIDFFSFFVELFPNNISLACFCRKSTKD